MKEQGVTMIVRLLVVHGRPQGKALLFPRGEFVFGRGEECHVRPNSDWVSRQHCLLRVAEDGVHLRDLGSRNGTLVNGARLKGECRLEHGDKLQVGPLVFRLEVDEAAPPAEHLTPGSSAEMPAICDTQEMNDVIPDTAEVRALRPRPEREAMPIDRISN
jgi:pSer/pThr/pTyr-binding forkhead associated (FHA) protein